MFAIIMVDVSIISSNGINVDLSDSDDDKPQDRLGGHSDTSQAPESR